MDTEKCRPISDSAAGWEAVADTFAALRSGFGIDTVRDWSRNLRVSAEIVDIGCGTGVPVSTTLAAAGFKMYGIDPSPTLLAQYRRHLPGARTSCELAEVSRFFDRRFDAAVAVGVLFLLAEDNQRALISRISRALLPGGHFLFSAPHQACRWNDSLTGRLSMSLGERRYEQLLGEAGCRLVGSYVDEGSNYYYHAMAG